MSEKIQVLVVRLHDDEADEVIAMGTHEKVEYLAQWHQDDDTLRDSVSYFGKFEEVPTCRGDDVSVVGTYTYVENRDMRSGSLYVEAVVDADGTVAGS